MVSDGSPTPTQTYHQLPRAILHVVAGTMASERDAHALISGLFGTTIQPTVLLVP